MPPGTWLATVISAVTLGTARYGRGCQSRARALDAAGWRGLPRLALRTIARRIRSPR